MSEAEDEEREVVDVVVGVGLMFIDAVEVEVGRDDEDERDEEDGGAVDGEGGTMAESISIMARVVAVVGS